MKATNPNTFLFFLLTAALLVMGCDQQKDAGSEGEASTLLSRFVVGYPDGTEVPGNRPLEERRQAMEDFKAASKAFRRAAQSASSWQEANRNIRALLAESSPVPQFIREQLAADRMLDHWLLEGEKTPEKQEVLSFYTDLMIKNRNPQAEITQPALERLRGHWPEQRIVETAGLAAQAAREDMQHGKTRKTMQEANQMVKEGLETKEAEQSFSNSTNSFRSQLAEAIDRLEAMSKSSQ